jgi:hypothetical protein
MFMMVMHQLPRLVCWTNVPVKTFDPPPGEVHCHHLRRAPSWSTPALVEFVDDAAVNSDDDAEMERSQVKQEVQTDSTAATACCAVSEGRHTVCHRDDTLNELPMTQWIRVSGGVAHPAQKTKAITPRGNTGNRWRYLHRGRIGAMHQ